MSKELKDVQIGDMVFVHNGLSTYIKPVQKITPSGLIKVNGTLFNPDGRMRGGSMYCHTYIEVATPEKIKEFKEQIYIDKVITKLKDLLTFGNLFAKITFEQAEEINRIFNFRQKIDYERKTYCFEDDENE